MKLKISAPTNVLDVEAGDSLVTDLDRLAALDGLRAGECFSDYLLDDSDTKELPSKGVSGGYMLFRLLSDLGELWVETEFDLQEDLSEEEIGKLVLYTIGQWNDGIGEGFCPDVADQTGLFVLIQFEDVVSKVSN